MFPGSYFAKRYFAARYWTKKGAPSTSMRYSFYLIVEQLPAV